MKERYEKSGFWPLRRMLGIAATCLLVPISLLGCATFKSPVMIQGSDYYWSTNGQQRVLCLTKTGYMKIVGLKIDWK